MSPSSPRSTRTRRATRATTSAGDGARLWRWPALLLVLVAVLAGVAVQRDRDANPPAAAAVDPAGLLPVASPAEALSSTWYCAGGTATGTKEGEAEQTVQIANDSDRALTATVTVVPDQGAPVAKAVAVPAAGRADLVVSSVVAAPFAAAVVEVPGGQVAVSHLLSGPSGRAEAACSSAPSADWYVPAGRSVPGTRQLLAVFNPFPSDAVVGLSFQTDDGARTPQKFEAVVIPGRRVVMLDVSAVITLRTQIATTLTARSGRVVVDQIQATAAAAGRSPSLTVTPGAPHDASTWWFADGPAGEGINTKVVVQNPTDDTAEVELQVRLDDAATNGSVEPFEATIAPHQYAEIVLSGSGRVPQGVGYAAVAVSRNGVPIVAERVVEAEAPAFPTGMTVTLGSPAVASHWLVPVGSGTYLREVTVVVTNPSSTDPVTVTVATVSGGVVTPLANGEAVQISGGSRGGFAVPTGAGAPDVAVDVEAGSDVIVEVRMAFTSGGIAQPLAVPVLPTATAATSGLPPAAPGDVVPLAPDAGDGTVPADVTPTNPGDPTTTVAPTAGSSTTSTTAPAGAAPGG